ncbi:hypothetical protein Riv7116_6606 [Rivularia sp. PCC 7116]|uniref:hypothetical protein n=1 Tax=Rivularia sp. PCC 7116 TaxID=373994 RepID=UPI00029EFD99|nr:hypothetical protein [Rivularia sp. PCC 7116]AFY58933.1 hypothetical protein Riv7116_6606 [Rivularia sp. PCC 7116]
MKKNVLILGLLASISLFGCAQKDYLSSTDGDSEVTNSASNVSATTEESKGLIESSLGEYLKTKSLKLEDTPHKVQYTDLNGDNIKDALTIFTGSKSCTDNGCNMLVHQGIGDNKFKLVSDIAPVKSPITISEKTTGGWRDVIANVGSEAKPKNVALKFDGKGYPENASSQPIIEDSEIKGDKLAFETEANKSKKTVDNKKADADKADKTATAGLSSKCQAAIDAGKTEVANVSGIGVNKSSKNDISSIYQNLPKERSVQYQFTVGGSGGKNIVYSPVFMSKISKNIISNCNNIGSVKFEVDQTDNRVAYGLVKDSVKKFDCTSPTAKSKLKWGEISCP